MTNSSKPNATNPSTPNPTASTPTTTAKAAKAPKVAGEGNLYEIKIEGGFTGVFRAASPAEAQRLYMAYFGVRSTTRSMSCEVVTDEEYDGTVINDPKPEPAAEKALA